METILCRLLGEGAGSRVREFGFLGNAQLWGVSKLRNDVTKNLWCGQALRCNCYLRLYARKIWSV